MTITSFTDSAKSYETTEHNCTCGDWQFRGSKTGKDCKHMRELKRREIEARENRACYERMMSSPW